MKSSLSLLQGLVKNARTGSRVNSWNEWDPLREVVVGRATHNFPAVEKAYDPLLTPQVHKEYHAGLRPMDRVHKAREQLEGFVKVLEDRGVIVHRPDLEYDFSAPAATADWSVPRQYGASCPRDPLIVVGSEVMEATMSFRSRYHEYLSYKGLLSTISKEDPLMRWVACPKPRMLDNLWRADYPASGPEAEDTEELFDLVKRRIFKTTEAELVWDAADVVRFGKDLFVMHGKTTNQRGYEWLKRHFAQQGIRVHQLHFERDTNPMHIDVNVVPLSSSTCMVNQDYGTPEWFEAMLKDNGWNVFGGVQSDKECSDYAMCGMCLSLNLFSIDPQHVMCDENATTMMNLLSKQGFTPVPVGIDYLNEFGGGPHCVTLDLDREGNLQSYFPMLDEMEAKGLEATFTPTRPWPMAESSHQVPSLPNLKVPLWEKHGTAIDRNAPTHAATNILKAHTPSEPFAIVDYQELSRLANQWRSHLPMAQPFHSVQANKFPALLKALATEGVGFDVATDAEIATVLDLGLDNPQFIVSNVHKTPGTLMKMADENISLAAFDSESELVKLSEAKPDSKVLLQLAVGDAKGMGGALEHEQKDLLALAAKLGLSCVGVIFHAGTATSAPGVYSAALEAARRSFQVGLDMGHPMHILDVGGGFTKTNLPASALAIRTGLSKHFHDVADLKVMAACNGYFAASSMSIVCNVIGVRQRESLREVWLGDGIYGGFDEAAVRGGVLPHPLPLGEAADRARSMTRLYGPTCDSLDTLEKGMLLEHLEVGDWLLFPNMGAYSWHGNTSDFNGFEMEKMKVFDLSEAQGQ